MMKKESTLLKIGIFFLVMNFIFAAVFIYSFIATNPQPVMNTEGQKLAKDFLNATKAVSGIQAVLFVIGANCPPGFTPYMAAEGRFILGAANGDQVTGGSSTISINEMPSHNHYINRCERNATASGGTNYWSTHACDLYADYTNSVGGGQPYWQPYVRLKPCVWQHN